MRIAVIVLSVRFPLDVDSMDAVVEVHWADMRILAAGLVMTPERAAEVAVAITGTRDLTLSITVVPSHSLALNATATALSVNVI